jgi:hypothetical protein
MFLLQSEYKDLSSNLKLFICLHKDCAKYFVFQCSRSLQISRVLARVNILWSHYNITFLRMYCKIATTVHLYCRTTTRTMDVYIIWLLVHMSINNIILANGFKIKTTMFRVRRSKQHDVRKCAMEILNNVSNSTNIILSLSLFL